ncbi:MAG: hypothetical protein OHK0031_12260 [Anaerolineales bacterium]
MKFDPQQLLTPRVMLGTLGLAAFLLLMTFGWLLLSAPPAPRPAEFVAAQTVIPAPTGTPRLPASDASPQTATPAPGQILLDGYVQISGTEGQGLRIRATPGLSGEFLFLAYDTEIFRVQDGPQEKDGYTWWKIVSNYDETRAGWAAANFLSAIDAPQ